MKEYNIENNIVIGHIGRLTEQKNTLFIIDVFNAFIICLVYTLYIYVFSILSSVLARFYSD